MSGVEDEKQGALLRLYVSLIHRENELESRGLSSSQILDDSLVRDILKTIEKEEGRQEGTERFRFSKAGIAFIVFTGLTVLAAFLMTLMLKAL